MLCLCEGHCSRAFLFLAPFLYLLVSVRKMPERKKPSSLQSLALRRIGQLFSSTCQDITKEVIHCLNQDYAYLSFAQLKAKKSTLLCDSITQIQNCFFVDTAYYFHERIFLECLVSDFKACTKSIYGTFALFLTQPLQFQDVQAFGNGRHSSNGALISSLALGFLIGNLFKYSSGVKSSCLGNKVLREFKSS